MYGRKQTRKALNTKRANKGEALISAVIGSAILVPIALMVLDLVFLVLVNSANDNLAHSAARAAANQQNAATANSAATDIVMGFHTSEIVPNANLDLLTFTKESVTVNTSIDVKLPARFPGMPTYITFRAADSEPVVGIPATL
ncbi:unnamed protein product [Sphagnum jensenii]